MLLHGSGPWLVNLWHRWCLGNMFLNLQPVGHDHGPHRFHLDNFMIEIGFSPVKRLVPVSSAVQSQHLPMMEATGQTWAGFVQISQHLENTGKSMRTICYIHQMPWAPRPAKLLGPNLHKKWTLCLWLETWGIYLVNQYVICTQPVLYQYRPILWNGVS